MGNPDNSLPTEVLEAIRDGNPVEAIKRLRHSTGLGLREAKHLIETHVNNEPKRAAREALLTRGVPAAALDALQRGSMLEAARLLYAHKRAHVLEARPTSDRASRPIESQTVQPPEAFNLIVNVLWWILALVLGGFVAYYFLRNPG